MCILTFRSILPRDTRTVFGQAGLELTTSRFPEDHCTTAFPNNAQFTITHFNSIPMVHWTRCLLIPFPLSSHIFVTSHIYLPEIHNMDSTKVTAASISVVRCSKYPLRVNICRPRCTEPPRRDACCGLNDVFLQRSKEYGLIPPTYRKGPFPCNCTRKVNKRFHP